MTLYRAQVVDTPDDPFRGGALRCDGDAGLLVEDGRIVERDAFATLRSRHPEAQLVELSDGVLLPGLVDAHVHFPQVRVIGALGMPLLEWLERCALPEEARIAEIDYARVVAGEFVSALTSAGTTTALVFGSHFAPAVDALFQAAAGHGLRITSGLVVGDRMLRPELHTSAERSYDEGRELARRWHGVGRSRYAVTPRFALSCSDELLASCGELHRDVVGSWFTSHLNENLDEVATVRRLSGTTNYLDCYDRHGLVGRQSVFAHNVHSTDTELTRLAEAQASVAHCPTSNAALGSGMFPLNRHLAHGVLVALGCDVGAGTGFSLLKEGLQTYLLQRLRGADGVPLTAAHLLHMATAAGAQALGLRDQIGDLSAGRRFDAIWIRPRPGTVLEIGIRHSNGPEDALAKVFALATADDLGQVWIDGAPVRAKAIDARTLRPRPVGNLTIFAANKAAQRTDSDERTRHRSRAGTDGGVSR
ncbi:guanine deaminase [Micromonospora sp. WMMA1998]|uniref:guanine deaminase n=1 Tax=unclassified Micromonospora TaxID=2617518 RepID=UPI00248C7C95|nr:guanine deaminase [Micromonospora sp. WMMA1998]WBC16775.1 guanine deaminase [Micromonospora sp. WMMA1998]